MAASVSFGQLQSTSASPAPKPESFFRIAVLGDFSGRGNRGEKDNRADLEQRKGRPIDRDNFDEVLARFEPRLELPLPRSKKKAELTFRSLDDFNPNEIHDRVDKFLDCDTAAEKSVLMNALLHHADFQSLESAWLGLDWLLRRVLKGNPRIQVVVFDLSLDELRDDLTDGDDLGESALCRLLMEHAGEEEPWGLVVGHYLFDTTVPDISLLGRLAKIANRAGAPFLADAHPRLLSADVALDTSVAAAWKQLRQLPEAIRVGLALPRFLLRLPYGERTRSIDNFAYEEFTGPEDNCYLWGSAALACGALMGMAFNKEGWAFQPGKILDLDAMHIHTYRDADDDEQVTLAEAWLTRPAAEKLVSLGVMPLLCVKGKDTVQLLHFASVAEPPQGQRVVPLRGRWGQQGMAAVPRGVKPPVTVGVKVGAEVATGRAASAPAPAAPARQDETAAPLAPAADAPADDAMDPELAALMAQMDSGTEPAVAAEAPAEEAMDPELAALMAELEGGTASAPAEAPAPAEEAMDPELAKLMAELEAGADTTPAAPATEAPAQEAATEERDPELAALMSQLESDAPAEPPAPAAPAPADDMDPELAALMSQLESDAPTASDSASSVPDQVEQLGGLDALATLGWPVFVPAFAEDRTRQLRILQSGSKNQAVVKEVADLVKRCGGYAALAEQGVNAEMGLNDQLTILRQVKRQRDQQKDLNDPELQAMAKAYGANLRLPKTESDKLALLAQLKDFDKWASDPRNQDAVNALEGTKFAERRQIQLEQEFVRLGGDSAYESWAADHPADVADSLEQKVALLRLLREFNHLGGDNAYRREAAGQIDIEEALPTKLEHLKAIRAAKE